MSNFNKVILMGNLTRDPQLKYLPSNTPVCDFGLAINHRWRDKDGNQKEDVCFVDVSAFGRQGEVINQYMTKGKSILIEGRLKLDTWTGQDGQKRSKHGVIVENFTFVGPRDAGQGGGAPHERSGPPAARAAPGRAPAPQSQYADAPPSQFAPDEPPPTSEDIPF